MLNSTVLVSQFGSPQKQSLRKGFGGREFAWLEIPGSSSEGVPTTIQERKKSQEGVPVNGLPLGAARVQPPWEYSGESWGTGVSQPQPAGRIQPTASFYNKVLLAHSQAHPFSWIAVTDTVWPEKLKIFTIRILRGKVANSWYRTCGREEGSWVFISLLSSGLPWGHRIPSTAKRPSQQSQLKPPVWAKAPVAPVKASGWEAQRIDGYKEKLSAHGQGWTQRWVRDTATHH